MAKRFLSIGRTKARINDRRNRLQDLMQDRRAGLEQTLGELSGLASGAYGSAGEPAFDAGAGLDERFGDQIQFQTDRIRQNRAGAVNAIQTALMAGGGDITGSGGALLGEFTEDANNAIGEALSYYTELNEGINRDNRRLNLRNRQFEEGRGDRLTLAELGTEQDLLNTTLGRLMNTNMLDIQRRNANRQFLSDVIGSIFSTAGKSKFITGKPGG